MTTPVTLNQASLIEGVHYLARVDPDLAGVFIRLGPPPLWTRTPGFPTLLRIILEQQVSLASAQATFDRLLAAASPLAPEHFLTLDTAQLKAIGFSRQKASYGRSLAQALVDGSLDLAGLARQDEATVRAELTKIKGIGPWTANIYLLIGLGRPDIWPSGDLALAVAAQRLKRLPARPTPAELESLAQVWRPWRAVAARLLWHDYLGGRPG
jgi:DNA-3-methyladenine glycosylase II